MQKTSFSPSVLRYAPWSISKLGQLERCLQHFKLRYIDKIHGEGTAGAAARIGSTVHAALERGLIDNSVIDMASALESAAVTSYQLSTEELRSARTFLDAAQDFVERISRFREKFGVKAAHIELELAVDTEFLAIGYKNTDAFLRGKIDLGLLTNDDLFVVIDHKTGRQKALVEHYPQLYSYALMSAALPAVKGVQCAIHYVGNPELHKMPLMYKPEIDTRIRQWFTGYVSRLEPRLAAIEAGEIELALGWECEYCEYADVAFCPQGAVEVVKRKGHRNSLEPNI